MKQMVRDAKDANEFERIVKWRFDLLCGLGLTPEQAMSLIQKPDIVHSVQELLEKGCPLPIVLSLLED